MQEAEYTKIDMENEQKCKELAKIIQKVHMELLVMRRQMLRKGYKLWWQLYGHG